MKNSTDVIRVCTGDGCHWLATKPGLRGVIKSQITPHSLIPTCLASQGLRTACLYRITIVPRKAIPVRSRKKQRGGGGAKRKRNKRSDPPPRLKVSTGATAELWNAAPEVHWNRITLSRAPSRMETSFSPLSVLR